MPRTVLSPRIALAASFALAAAAALPAAGRETVKVEARIEWAKAVHKGYWPLTVDLDNWGSPAEGVVELKSRTGTGSPVEIRRPVSLGRGEKARVILPVPVEDWSLYELRFLVDGRSSIESARGIRGPGSIGNGGRRSVAVIAVDYAPPDLRQINAALASRGYGSLEAAHVRPQALPDLWQPYSSIALCVIHARALSQLAPAQVRALRQWIFAGGACLVHAAGDRDTAADLWAELGLPAPGSLRPAPPVPDLRPGSLRPAPPVPDLGPGGVLRRGTGLGEFHFAREDLFPGTEARWRAVLNRTEPGLGSGVTRAARGGFQIPGVGKPPVKVFIALSILFVILIGPVNWYVVLHRMKKQVLFLVTTPAIAVVTSVLMLTYSFVSEGFGTHARIESLAVIDLASRRGVTWSRHAVYAALPPWGGLRFGASTLVLPVKVPEGPRSIAWGDGQRLVSGWLPARTYASYVTCAHYPARWRVEIDRDGGGYAITNGLPRSFRRLLVKTAEGSYAAGDVPEGARVPLRPARGAPDLNLPKFVDKAFRIPRRGIAVLEDLPPGSFVAELDGPLGAELGLEGYSEEQGVHLVIGIAGAASEEF